MSFIKKEKEITLQTKKAPALQKSPNHPMLKWSAVRGPKKTDHLEHYVEVRPFASAETKHTSKKHRRRKLDLLGFTLNRVSRAAKGVTAQDRGLNKPDVEAILLANRIATGQDSADSRVHLQKLLNKHKTKRTKSKRRSSDSSDSSDSDSSDSDSSDSSDSDDEDRKKIRQKKKKKKKKAKLKAREKLLVREMKLLKRAKKKLSSAEAKYEPSSKFLPTEGKTIPQLRKALGLSAKTSRAATATGTKQEYFKLGQLQAKYDAKFGSSSGGSVSTIAKAAGWAWGSAENKEVVKSKFSAMGAASSGFWWCMENKAVCATGAVVGVAGSYIAITAAVAYITAAAAVAAYYSAIGLLGLGLFATAAIAIRTASLKTYEAGEEFASLSTRELKAKIVELKANQCYKFDVRSSCYTAAELLAAAEDALSFQNKICDGSDCAEVRALFDGDENEGLSEEEQDELIQKRKDLFFGHIWRVQESAEEDTFAELEANNRTKLQKMCDDFTRQNKEIFLVEDEGGHLVKASLTGSKGILKGEYETNDILKVLADKQKEMIGLHSAAVDEWVELYKAFEGHRKLIKQGGLLDNLPEKLVKSMTKKLEKAHDYKPPSSLLSDGDKDKQMTIKLKTKRKLIDQKVRKLQKIVNAIDASEEGSVVAKIQEEKQTKECFIESVSEITDIFREHQKDMGTSGGRSKVIEAAGIALEGPKKELMRRICDATHFPEDPLELAKWVLGNLRKKPKHDRPRRRSRDHRRKGSSSESESESESEPDEESDSDDDKDTRSIDDIFD